MHPCPAHSPESIQNKLLSTNDGMSIQRTAKSQLDSVYTSVCIAIGCVFVRKRSRLPEDIARTCRQNMSCLVILLFCSCTDRCVVRTSQIHKNKQEKKQKENNKHIDNPNNHPKMLRKEEIKVPICTLLPCFELSLHSCDLNVESEKSH